MDWESQVVVGNDLLELAAVADYGTFDHAYTLSEYTAIMRGESRLPHLPDGRCKECRSLFEKQVELLKRKGAWKPHYKDGPDYLTRRTWIGTVEVVQAGLRALCEQANG